MGDCQDGTTDELFIDNCMYQLFCFYVNPSTRFIKYENWRAAEEATTQTDQLLLALAEIRDRLFEHFHIFL